MSVTAILGGSPEEAAPQLDTAAAFAKRLNTKLNGLLAMPEPGNAFMYVAGPEMVMTGSAGIEAVIKAQDEAAKNMKDAFEDACTRAGPDLQTSFQREKGSVAAHAASAAMLSDALVFPRRSAHSDHALNPAFEHVLMQARMPLVLAGDEEPLNGPCVIAWDGSPHAARALRLHMPLIRAIGSVVIAQNPEKLEANRQIGKAVSPKELADWLHEEPISARTVTMEGPISEGLLQVARENEASLIVMGAYGHNRLGEMLFGGTSRAILNTTEGPAIAVAH